jgi:hypothetical protein
MNLLYDFREITGSENIQNGQKHRLKQEYWGRVFSPGVERSI